MRAVQDVFVWILSIAGIIGALATVALIVVVVARGDSEREEEDQARAFYDAHGHWPDEAPPPGPG